MMGCSIVLDKDNRVLKISGVIDENAEFDHVTSRLKTEVYVDMRDVSRMNSVGARQWVRFSNSTKVFFKLINTPISIVEQINMVPEFIGQNGTVESFYCNFLCLKCGHNEEVLFTVGKDVIAGQSSYESPVRQCPKCKSEMELDHDVETYFEFLARTAE